VSAAVVSVFAFVTASWFPFVREAYWAAIAGVVSLFPERKATMRAAVPQLFGSAVGGLVGWASASWWRHDPILYGVAVLVAIGVCYLLRCPDAARLAAVAVTIVTLIPLRATPQAVALHRFVEVSYGVACAIGYTAAVGLVERWWRRWRERRTGQRDRNQAPRRLTTPPERPPATG
jgi:uncharacterized membrane protein YgaE (UPF0421/DUF939 family)